MQQEMQNQEFNIKQDPYNYMLRVLFNRWKPYIIRAISLTRMRADRRIIQLFSSSCPSHRRYSVRI